MAEKKFGWGTVVLASSTAALVAGSVVAYLKREELKKFAEDVMAKVKPEDDDDLFEYDDDDLFEYDDNSEEEIERDIILTEEDDDEPADVEIEITIAEEDAEDVPAKAAGDE